MAQSSVFQRILRRLLAAPGRLLATPGTWVPEASAVWPELQLRNREDIARLIPRAGLGIELGVAWGVFSDALLEHSELTHLYSVDMYAGDRGHDDDQYRAASERLARHGSRSSLLRMRFEEALSLFPDNHFDFIYIDGYAHTGQNDGRTLEDWWPKLKTGGLFSGDDFSPHWPKNVAVVNRFAKSRSLFLVKLTPQTMAKGRGAHPYPSWLIRKE